jgi:isopentenyl-diphosphate Delta-isomerase
MDKLRIIIVNDRDEVIGHKECDLLVQEDIYRVAALWVTNSKGEILLAQRQLGKRHDPGKWGPAAAGTVDEGETYEDNIVKEAEEEIGLAGIKPIKGPKRRISDEHNYFGQWYTLVVDKPADEFVIQNEEVAQVRWFNRAELMRNLKDHPEHYLRDMDWNLENLG